MSAADEKAVLAFLRDAGGAARRRQLEHALAPAGAARAALGALLGKMCAAGVIVEGRGKMLRLAGALPKVAVLQVATAGREVWAEPAEWPGPVKPPRVRIVPGPRKERLRLEVGDRVLVKTRTVRGQSEGIVIRRIGRRRTHVPGIVREVDGQLVLQPTARRGRPVPLHHAALKDGVRPGELVFAEYRGTGARMVARVIERVARMDAPDSHLSDIAIAEEGIPDVFPDEVLAEADAAAARWAAVHPAGDAEDKRADRTRIPFVTIDPPDARDFDDAVHAEPRDGGWRLMVAIADVAWFVRPGGALDRSAYERGNSVYFPDRVVPMVPDVLSAGVCSLKAGEDRAALVAVLDVAADGAVVRHAFERARIRVVKNLSYEAAQQQMDAGVGPDRAALAPLWDCWAALATARRARAPLALSLPEQQVVLDADGRVAAVVERPHLPAHEVIEDMMIAANVAAAQTLEQRKAPVLYRAHEPPEREKLVGLKDYLETLGMAFALGQVMTPAVFNDVLRRAEGRDDYADIAEAVLRAQMQAFYTPRAAGHFGLALGAYVHFTSPIRRYADLVIHRSLIAALALGAGGVEDGSRLAAVGEHLSLAERRAMAAERATLDRYIARHLATSVGDVLSARIVSVREFGFFVRVAHLGGDGLVPISALGAERFRFDEKGRFLEGVESGRRFPTGAEIEVQLEAADMATGLLRFSLPGVAAAPPPRRPRFPRRGRARG